jgi:hypothetical protein
MLGVCLPGRGFGKDMSATQIQSALYDHRLENRVCDRPDSAHDLPDSREARAVTAWVGLEMLEMEL